MLLSDCVIEKFIDVFFYNIFIHGLSNRDFRKIIKIFNKDDIYKYFKKYFEGFFDSVDVEKRHIGFAHDFSFVRMEMGQQIINRIFNYS